MISMKASPNVLHKKFFIQIIIWKLKLIIGCKLINSMHIIRSFIQSVIMNIKLHILHNISLRKKTYRKWRDMRGGRRQKNVWAQKWFFMITILCNRDVMCYMWMLLFFILFHFFSHIYFIIFIIIFPFCLIHFRYASLSLSLIKT